MPSDRKESPSSQKSMGSSDKGGSDASSSGEAGRGTPVKPPDKQGPTSTPNSKKSLPAVKRAFKGSDSPSSSTSGNSRHTRHNAAMSRLSVNSMTSGGRTEQGSVCTLNATARPDVEVFFVSPLEKHQECPVCARVLRYPVQFDCKHHCCSGCLPELLRVEPRCPIDQCPIERDKVIVDKQLQRVLEQLPVLCSNNEKGCVWSERMRDLMPHLEECDYSVVTCPNGCDAVYERRFGDQHVTMDCPRRPISCLHCHLPLVKDEEAEHHQECPRIPVPCPNGCKHKEMPREEVPAHMETKCSKQEVQCSFHSLGCQHKCIRKELTDHNKADAEVHMTLVAEALAEYKRGFDNQTSALQKQTERLAGVEVRVESLEKLYGAQLVWKIDNYSERMEEAQKGKRTTIYSPPFFTTRHGYKMVASTCLNGDGKSRGKYMSLFICIVRGEYDTIIPWPFSHRVTFTLVDQALDPAARRNITYAIKPNICKENKAFLGRPTTDRNASFGSQRFAELEMLKTCDYVRDDIMFIKVVIDNEEMEAL